MSQMMKGPEGGREKILPRGIAGGLSYSDQSGNLSRLGNLESEVEDPEG